MGDLTFTDKWCGREKWHWSQKRCQALFSPSSLTFPSPLLFSFSFSEMSFQVFNRKVAKEVGALRGEVRSGGRGTWDQGWMKRSERV